MAQWQVIVVIIIRMWDTVPKGCQRIKDDGKLFYKKSLLEDQRRRSKSEGNFNYIIWHPLPTIKKLSSSFIHYFFLTGSVDIRFCFFFFFFLPIARTARINIKTPFFPWRRGVCVPYNIPCTKHGTHTQRERERSTIKTNNNTPWTTTRQAKIMQTLFFFFFFFFFKALRMIFFFC